LTGGYFQPWIPPVGNSSDLSPVYQAIVYYISTYNRLAEPGQETDRDVFKAEKKEKEDKKNPGY
jgi:hypothetical protein